MSVVVGVVTDTEVVIAADTALTGNFQTFGETKIARVGDAAIGWVGNSLWGTFARQWTKTLLDRTDVEAFAAAWRVYVKDLSLDEKASSGAFMVATEGGLFEITPPGSVCVVRHYTAIGMGESIALGSLYSLRGWRDLSTVDEAVVAVKAAIYHHPDCGGEVEHLSVAMVEP